MIRKERQKIIACILASLLYSHCVSARPNRSSIFNSLDVEDVEMQPEDIAPEEDLVYQNQIYPETRSHNEGNAQNEPMLVNESEQNDLKDLYSIEQTTENQQFYEGLDMPDEFSAQDIAQAEGVNNLYAERESEAPQEHQEDAIEFHFEDADIQNLLAQISDIFDVNFITDEILNPLGPAGKALKGNKISFKTHAPLSRKAAWNLFLTFLDLAGFSLVPEPEPNMYRVVASDRAQQSPVPTFIGTSTTELPDNDQMIRFVYFIENADMNTLSDIVGTLKSPTARAVLLREIKALIITDRAYNVKSLMQIVQELDQVSMPQSMSVLKLRTADVSDVKKLYDAVSASGDSAEGGQPRLFGARKQSGSIYFPENARLIAEPRTNSLIILGPLDAIKKIEDFIIRYVDVELEKPYSPLQTYQLRYASAATVSEIMNNMSQFGQDTPAGRAGGVRGGDKYLKPITFTPEPATNTIVIKGDYEDYLKALEIIKRLDEPQPQVAIEALILTMDYNDDKQIGSQIRNKVPGPNGLLGNSVDFQTSGLALGGTPQGIQTNPNGPGAERLLANLINLVVNAAAGNTVISLGADAFGVWGIFNVLQTVTNVQVVANPYLVASNKTKASINVGEIRRVVTSTVLAGTNETDAFGDFSAELKLEVTPQINSDGMIVLKLNVLFENFISSLSNDQEAAKLTRTVDTRTIVADKEVIAIGGLVQNQISETLSKVPILGDIPILGWLFRNKDKAITKSNLLILISTKIIEPEVTEYIDEHTQIKLQDYYDNVESFLDSGEYRDPVYRRFFDDHMTADDPTDVVENFFFNRRREVFNVLPGQEQTHTAPTTKDGKFYRPGAKKDTAIVVPPTEFGQTAPAASNGTFPRSAIIQQIMAEPEPIRIVQKTSPTRRRDARRSINSPEKSIGVLT